MIAQAKLILLIATLLAPLCFAANYYIKKPAILLKFLNAFFPLAFLSSLIAVYSKALGAKFSLDIITIFDHSLLAFLVDNIAYLFLFAVGAIWLIFNFYFRKIFTITDDENWQKHYLFFLAAVASIIFIIISKNILTILLFLALNFVIIYHFIRSFFDEEKVKNSQFFIILVALQSFVLLAALLISYHFNLSFDFFYESLRVDLAYSLDLSLLLILFFIALFSGAILPFYLFFYRNLNFEPKTVYIVFFLLSLAPALFFFARILNSLFGSENLEIIFNSNLFLIFKFLILFLSGFFGVALLLNKSIKTAFFYIFLQQILFCAFSLIFFARYNEHDAFLPLFALFLEFALLFLSTANLGAYLQKSQQKNFVSLFSKLTINCSLMLFSIFSMSGFAPSLGLIAKFYLFKNAIVQSDIISLLIFAVNSFSLLLFFAISLRFIFVKTEEKISEADAELAKTLDFDSSSIFGAIALLLALFIGLIAFSWIKLF